MATKLTKEEDSNIQLKKKTQENWKYPKIPVDQVYKSNKLGIFPNYIIKDFEETITINNNNNNENVTLNLLSTKFLQGFIKKQHEFLHLGLVQIAIKPLIRDGLGPSIIVCLRDVRHPTFQNSLLALVESDLSKGPLYFNCFPSFSVSLLETSPLEVFIMTRGVPLTLTYRVVCKAMVDLNSEALNEAILGETVFFQPACGTSCTTKWDEFELHLFESSTTSKEEPNEQSGNSVDLLPDGPVLINKGISMVEGSSHQIATNLDDWKYPKIPVDEVYNSNNHVTLNIETIFGYSSLWSKTKKVFNILPSFATKEFEKTITLKANNQDVCIKLLKGLIRKQNKLMHLGLVQIEIKPLIRNNGLASPIIVCLRDARLLDFEKSLSAVVQTDLCQGPFYFNHCPGHPISLNDDVSLSEVLTLNVRKSRIPLALTYRVVYKVTKNPILVQNLEEWVSGETSYFQPSTATWSTTKWNEVQLPEAWAHT